MKNLFLIDSNSLIHRCFHALPPLHSPKGEPVNALYGMANILTRIILGEAPDYVAALFDRPEPTFRKQKVESYKAHRPKAPDELVSQIISAHNLFEEFGISLFEEPGWEADDLIATLARKFGSTEGLRVVIMTGDLDTLQLVLGDKVVVRTFKKGITETMTYNEDAVVLRYGLSPREMKDYKCLVGDSSDNIRGVEGVGPKTAVKILQKYGSVREALKNAKNDPILKKIEGQEDVLTLNEELVSLKSFDKLSQIDLEDLSVRFSKEKVINYASKMGFKSLERRISGIGDSERAKEKEKPKNSQGSFF